MRSNFVEPWVREGKPTTTAIRSFNGLLMNPMISAKFGLLRRSEIVPIFFHLAPLIPATHRHNIHQIRLPSPFVLEPQQSICHLLHTTENVQENWMRSAWAANDQ